MVNTPILAVPVWLLQRTVGSQQRSHWTRDMVDRLMEETYLGFEQRERPVHIAGDQDVEMVEWTGDVGDARQQGVQHTRLESSKEEQRGKKRYRGATSASRSLRRRCTPMSEGN